MLSIAVFHSRHQMTDSTEDKDQKILTVRVPSELHREAAVLLAASGGKFQGLLIHLLRQWVEQSGSSTIPTTVDATNAAPQSHIPTQQAELVAAVLEVLESTDHKAAAALRKNIVAFRRLVRLHGAVAPDKKSGTERGSGSSGRDAQSPPVHAAALRAAVRGTRDKNSSAKRSRAEGGEVCEADDGNIIVKLELPE